jgi:hypothetical protein
MWASSRQIKFAAALSLALLAQANLLVAGLSPCGLPFGHTHFTIGHINPAALEAHLAAEAACRLGRPRPARTVTTDPFGRIISEPRGDSIAHSLENLSVLIGMAAPTAISFLLAASCLASRLPENVCPASPHQWRPPIPPPRLVSLTVN